MSEQPRPWLGDPVAEDFEYRSDTWGEQWTVEGLQEVLGTREEVLI